MIAVLLDTLQVYVAPGIGATEKLPEICGAAGLVICREPVGGVLSTVMGLQMLAPAPQAFTGFTQILPPLKLLPNCTVMLLLVEAPVAPEGKVH